MFDTNISAVFLLAAVASFNTSGFNMPAAQQTGGLEPSQNLAPREIHVDQHCRILPDPASAPSGKKARLRRDPIVCHLEAIFASEHLEKTIVGNQSRKTWVRIAEQEYLLQNVTSAPVNFIVEQYMPKGWVVDSDPPPAKTEGNVAVFLVNTHPGQIERLHVGLRYAKPLKTTRIKASP